MYERVVGTAIIFRPIPQFSGKEIHSDFLSLLNSQWFSLSSWKEILLILKLFVSVSKNILPHSNSHLTQRKPAIIARYRRFWISDSPFIWSTQRCRWGRTRGLRYGGAGTRWRWTRKRGGGGGRITWWRSGRIEGRRICWRSGGRGFSLSSYSRQSTFRSSIRR